MAVDLRVNFYGLLLLVKRVAIARRLYERASPSRIFREDRSGRVSRKERRALHLFSDNHRGHSVAGNTTSRTRPSSSMPIECIICWARVPTAEPVSLTLSSIVLLERGLCSLAKSCLGRCFSCCWNVLRTNLLLRVDRRESQERKKPDKRSFFNLTKIHILCFLYCV